MRPDSTDAYVPDLAVSMRGAKTLVGLGSVLLAAGTAIAFGAGIGMMVAGVLFLIVGASALAFIMSDVRR